MIHFISRDSIIVLRDSGFFIVESNMVGYQVFVSDSQYNKNDTRLSNSLYIWPTFNERTGYKYYGFESPDSWKLAQLFANISGIGPSLAARLVQSWEDSLEAFYKCIQTEDAVSICARCRGIGNKRVQSIIQFCRDNKLVGFPEATGSGVSSALARMGFNLAAIRIHD